MTGGTLASEAATPAEYFAAKISVWWDLDSCPVHRRRCDTVAKNIKSALLKLGHHGSVSISAYGRDISASYRSSTEISFKYACPVSCSNTLLLDLMGWTLENPSPANILFICGEALYELVHLVTTRSRYNVMLAGPPPPPGPPPPTKWYPIWMEVEAREAEAMEAEYLGAQTSVWWHIESCPVLGVGGCNVKALAKNIKSALDNLGYCGPVSIFAYGDTDGITESFKRDRSSTEISLNNVPAGESENRMLFDMMVWALDNNASANFLLISGDSVFSPALHHLVGSGYNVLLAQPRAASCAAATLAAAAKTVWIWDDLFAGGSPIGRSCDEVPSSQMLNVSSSSTVSQGGGEVPIRRMKYTKLDYMTGKTSVWWDVENCPVPSRIGTGFATNIKSALRNLGYSDDRVSIFAYGYNDERFPSYITSHFASTGISLNPVILGEEKRDINSKYSTDMKMMVDMFAWALKNPFPANILYISSYMGFCSTLEALNKRGYNILAATYLNERTAPIGEVADTVWSYRQLLDGEPPYRLPE